MESRIVAFKSFAYSEMTEDPRKPGSGELVKQTRTARRGDEIELTEEEAARGDLLGAFVVDTPEEELEEFDVTEAGVDELQEWIENDQPSAKEVVDAAEGDVEVARRLVEAEEATGSPRKSVIEPLGALIARENQ